MSKVVGLVAIGAIVILGGCEGPLDTGGSGGGASETQCVDVTSYEDSWQNDMKYTKPDGTVFYTDYAGAEAYE